MYTPKGTPEHNLRGVGLGLDFRGLAPEVGPKILPTIPGYK